MKCRGWNGDENCQHDAQPNLDGRCNYHAIHPHTVTGWLLGGVVYPVRQSQHISDTREQRMVVLSGACWPVDGDDLRCEWHPKFEAARAAMAEYRESIR